MMILGFFGVGFMAYRRKQNGTGAASRLIGITIGLQRDRLPANFCLADYLPADRSAFRDWSAGSSIEFQRYETGGRR
jgi:hypothetical protein